MIKFWIFLENIIYFITTKFWKKLGFRTTIRLDKKGFYKCWYFDHYHLTKEICFFKIRLLRRSLYINELKSDNIHLIFHESVAIYYWKSENYHFRVGSIYRFSNGDHFYDAVNNLCVLLAKELKHLIGTPTCHLSEKDVRRKGQFLSCFDVENSEFRD